MGWDAMTLFKKQFQYSSTFCGKYQSVANSWRSVRFCSAPLSDKALIFDYFNSFRIARSVAQANAFKVVMHKDVIRYIARVLKQQGNWFRQKQLQINREFTDWLRYLRRRGPKLFDG